MQCVGRAGGRETRMSDCAIPIFRVGGCPHAREQPGGRRDVRSVRSRPSLRKMFPFREFLLCDNFSLGVSIIFNPTTRHANARQVLGMAAPVWPTRRNMRSIWTRKSSWPRRSITPMNRMPTRLARRSARRKHIWLPRTAIAQLPTRLNRETPPGQIDQRKPAFSTGC